MRMWVIPWVERGGGGEGRGMTFREPRFWPFLAALKNFFRRRLAFVGLGFFLRPVFLLVVALLDELGLRGGAGMRLCRGGTRTNLQASLFILQFLHGPV